MADDRYVLLWERILDSEEWRRGSNGQRVVMVALLVLANWRQERVVVRGATVEVPRGALFGSTRGLAERIGVSHKTMRVSLRFLAKSGFLEVDQGTAGTLVRLCKYEHFQDRVPHQGTECGKNAPQCAPDAPERAPEEHTVCPERPSDLYITNKPIKKEKRARRADKAKAPATNLLQRYYEHFKVAHQRPPVVSWAGANLTSAKQLLKGPPERAPEDLDLALKAYVRSDDRFYQAKGHPFALFPSWLQQHESGQLGLPGYAENPNDEDWDLPEEEAQRFRRRP